MKSRPSPLLAAVVSAASVFLPHLSPAATIVFNTSSGNWNQSSNWSPTTVPGTTDPDDAVIRSGRSALINTNVSSGSGSVTNVYIGGEFAGNPTAGTVTLQTGGVLNVTGDLQVKRQNQNGTGTFTATGGSFSANNFYVGLGTAGTGTATLSGSSAATISNNTIVGDNSGASGFLEIVGSNVSLSGNSFSLRSTGTLKFTLDATGISTLNFSGTANFASGSNLLVDGSSYTGGSAVFTLLDASGFSAFSSTQSITGFDPLLYTTSLSYDAATTSVKLNITAAVPEPQTWLLLGLGGLAMVVCQRRNKLA